MSEDPVARLGSRIRAHLAAHPPEGLALHLAGLTAIPEGVRALFHTDTAMRFGDRRLPDAVNACLQATLADDVETRAWRVEVQVDVADAPPPATPA